MNILYPMGINCLSGKSYNLSSLIITRQLCRLYSSDCHTEFMSPFLSGSLFLCKSGLILFRDITAYVLKYRTIRIQGVLQCFQWHMDWMVS